LADEARREARHAWEVGPSQVPGHPPHRTMGARLTVHGLHLPLEL